MHQLQLQQTTFFFFFLSVFFRVNKTWQSMWIICLAEDSHEISRLIFYEKLKNNKNKIKMLFATVVIDAIMVKMSWSNYWKYGMSMLVIVTADISLWGPRYRQVRLCNCIFSKYLDTLTLSHICPKIQTNRLICLTFPTLFPIQQTANWYFSYFSLKIGFDISCKLSPLEKYIS